MTEKQEYLLKFRRLSLRNRIYGRLFGKKEERLIRQGEELKGRAAAADLKIRIAECGKSLKELLEEGLFDRLNSIYEDYFQIQLSEEFLGNGDFRNEEFTFSKEPVLIELEDELFLAGVTTLFYTERMYEASRLIEFREKAGSITEEMRTLKSDIERFRTAATLYINRNASEAESIVSDLLERYPKNPGLLKFRCRFLMNRAQENPGEAERFVGECCKLFPEDGFFLKYKADLLWMNGSCQKALVLYAEARGKTSDPTVQEEMDYLLRKCKKEVLDTCERLLECRAKEEANQLMELWLYLMPEDEEVKACFSLTKVFCAATQTELEGIIKEILEVIEEPMVTVPEKKEGEEAPEEKKETPGEAYYKKALTKAWRRLGYPAELASLYTEVKCASEESELEWLAEEIRSHQIKKEMRAEVYKLVGDVRLKQGQTIFAFENYQKALEYAKPSYVKTELVRIILSDLSQGSKRVKIFAKDSNAMPFLDGWLGKYGNLEELMRTISQLV